MRRNSKNGAVGAYMLRLLGKGMAMLPLQVGVVSIEGGGGRPDSRHHMAVLQHLRVWGVRVGMIGKGPTEGTH